MIHGRPNKMVYKITGRYRVDGTDVKKLNILLSKLSVIVIDFRNFEFSVVLVRFEFFFIC